MRDNFSSKWAEVSKGIFKNDWVKKIEIRIEKEQRRNDSMKAKGRSPPTLVQNEQKLEWTKDKIEYEKILIRPWQSRKVVVFFDEIKRNENGGKICKKKC